MILSVSRRASLSPVKPGGSGETAPIKSPSESFQKVFDRIGQSGDIHQELMSFRSQLVRGKEFQPQELLYYQIRAGQYGVKVELVSRLAESVNHTVKRLQNQG